MKTIKLTMLAITAILAVSSCKKETTNEAEKLNLDSDLVILNFGGWGANNASISFFNNSTGNIENEKFKSVNGRGLGDSGNDIAKYNGNLFAVLNGSNTVEVFDASTFVSVAQISTGQNSEPRHIAFHNNNAFVSNSNGTVTVIDLTTYSISKIINVGKYAEELIVISDKLYVANSGNQSLEVDSTISVIDLNSLEEIKKITVGKNPKKLFYINNFLYVQSQDTYGPAPDYEFMATSNLYAINLSTEQVDTLQPNCQDFYTVDNNAFFYDYSSLNNYDLNTNSISEITTSLSNISFYGLGGILNGYYVTDAKDYTIDGQVHFYDNSWAKIGTLNVGVSPNEVLILD